MKRLVLIIALAGIMFPLNGCAVYARPYDNIGISYSYAPYGGYSYGTYGIYGQYGYSPGYYGYSPRYYNRGWRGYGYYGYSPRYYDRGWRGYHRPDYGWRGRSWQGQGHGWRSPGPGRGWRGRGWR